MWKGEREGGGEERGKEDEREYIGGVWCGCGEEGR